MKSTFLIIVLLFVGCSQKPNNLIPEAQMQDIWYDMALLRTIQISQPNTLIENGIDTPKIYIYKKYNIDSVTYFKSNAYYASEPENYKWMHKKVLERVQAELDKQANNLKTSK